jgi:hypothetical protein
MAQAPLCGPAGEDLDWLVSVCDPAHAIGIDALFGWPERAVQALVSWAAPPADDDALRIEISREGWIHLPGTSLEQLIALHPAKLRQVGSHRNSQKQVEALVRLLLEPLGRRQRQKLIALLVT